jgi:putative ABC transport system ATP-binding protein
MITVTDLAKTYHTRGGRVEALAGIDLHIDAGEFVALCGPSGSGKTTLLMTVAAMLRPTSGSVRLGQRDIYEMNGRERAAFRAANIGFVFQMFHLVPYLTVIENVLIAAGAVGRKDQKTRVEQLLEQLGMRQRVWHKPAELSAGEKQRTAIARALLNQPKLILADEPTGNLDPANARAVLEHLKGFQQSGGTVVVATHGPAAKEFATRTVYLRDGKLDGDS